MPRTLKTDWPRVAAELATRVPRAALHPATVKWAHNHDDAAASWGVAFSGGADSLALLLLIWAHWPERRAKLVALHFDHRLRGRASTADAKFCERVCLGLGVRFVTGSWTKSRKGASEAESRTARFAFFQRELGRRRIRALWFGHQQDDIAETLLMRLARGSGSAGLAAPRPVHVMPEGRVHVRPLLALKKQVIIEALTAAGAVWREDASNETADYFRNRIRHEALPHWIAAAEGRDALAGAALSRELIEEDDVALEAWVDALSPVSADGRCLDVKVLKDKPRAVVRRALHRWLAGQRDIGDLSRQGFNTLLAAVEKGSFTRFSLGRGGFAVLRKGVLLFEEKLPVDPPETPLNNLGATN
ncbi:tRNA lysidine(34) synthetase TilS [Rariglobus hedericola]|uniref:tRNA(Ile)-lysidine synthase n=1 Tax=Rariglobus hedericola TaxID=2597822 RepID=A0A556QNT5_9BACT|nr:tRNA lysidine(34) synthetase TilS [Rariglobus hedericola]TSJ78318.1 tRNA lysidine(34) synthetase TilS [Rariglobus hedericola]